MASQANCFQFNAHHQLPHRIFRQNAMIIIRDADLSFIGSVLDLNPPQDSSPHKPRQKHPLSGYAHRREPALQRKNGSPKPAICFTPDDYSSARRQPDSHKTRQTLT